MSIRGIDMFTLIVLLNFTYVHVYACFSNRKALLVMFILFPSDHSTILALRLFRTLEYVESFNND